MGNENEDTKHLTLRLSASLVERIEALEGPLKRHKPEVALTGGDMARAELIRLVLYEGLISYEDQLDIEPKQADLLDDD